METQNSVDRHTLAYTDVERNLGIMIARNLKSEYQVIKRSHEGELGTQLPQENVLNFCFIEYF
jgi:hypothetical protein